MIDACPECGSGQLNPLGPPDRNGHEILQCFQCGRRYWESVNLQGGLDLVEADEW